MNFDVVWDNRDFLLEGLLVTLEISVLAILLALVLGVLTGGIRAYGRAPFTWLAALYVDVFRSIPFLVILLWLYFAPPFVLGIGFSPFWASVLALGVHEGAYFAEIFRGGMISIRQGQMQAGLALGMSRLLVIRRVILPQATIRMLPPAGTYCGAIIQKSAVCSVVATAELTRNAQLLTSVTYRPFEIFSVVMVVYAAIVFLLIRCVESCYRRLASRGAS